MRNINGVMIITILAPCAPNRKDIFDVPFSEKKVKETKPTLEKDVSLSKWYWEKGTLFRTLVSDR